VHLKCCNTLKALLCIKELLQLITELLDETISGTQKNHTDIS